MPRRAAYTKRKTSLVFVFDTDSTNKLWYVHNLLVCIIHTIIRVCEAECIEISHHALASPIRTFCRQHAKEEDGKQLRYSEYFLPQMLLYHQDCRAANGLDLPTGSPQTQTPLPPISLMHKHVHWARTMFPLTGWATLYTQYSYQAVYIGPLTLSCILTTWEWSLVHI